MIGHIIVQEGTWVVFVVCLDGYGTQVTGPDPRPVLLKYLLALYTECSVVLQLPRGEMLVLACDPFDGVVDIVENGMSSREGWLDLVPKLGLEFANAAPHHRGVFGRES